jgi:hypothetical protein
MADWKRNLVPFFFTVMPMTALIPAFAQSSDLSPLCLQPSRLATPCGFYGECLEAGRACEKSPDAYALSYGAKYCTRFTELAASNLLTPTGRRWVEETRACLQDALVDQLPGGTQANGSCRSLRTAAFDSHPFCYFKSGVGFCRLPLGDYPRVLALFELPDLATVESVRQMVQVIDSCLKRLTGRESLNDAERTRVLWQWRERLGTQRR